MTQHMKHYITYLSIVLIFFLYTDSFSFAGADTLILAQSSSSKGILNSLFGAEDSKPPDIELDEEFDGVVVYTEKLYISGHVTDSGTVKALIINETPAEAAPGRSIMFSHLAALREGKNIITIEARDDAGNIAKKDITVIRENPQLSKLPKEVFEKRMRLAVYPFDQKGIVSETSSIFMDLLTLALQDQQRFQLVERISLDRALEEQKLSLSQVIDRNAALTVGKMMSAQAIITGSIVKMDAGIEIVGRMIDTETSEIVATEKLYSAREGIPGMSFLAQALAVRFHNHIPMLGGIVVDRKGDSIFTSLGEGDASKNTRVMIYRDNSTGSAVLGHGRITQVSADMSKAEMIQGSPDAIRKLDWVIVQ